MAKTVVTTIANSKHIELLKGMGFSRFNLHLINKDVTPQQIKKIVSEADIDIISIHVPFSNSDQVLIENIGRYDAIPYTAQIANLLRKNEKIYVVCHTEMGKSIYEHPKMIYNISQSIDELLTAYPSIVLAIENTMIFNSFNRSISQGALPSYCDFVRLIKDKSKYPERICSVLDICHAKATIYTIRQIFSDWSISLEDYFKKNEGLCEVVHVANVYGTGYTKSTHGIGYDPAFMKDVSDLQSIINLFYTYIPDACFMYEISESDYDNRAELNNTMESMIKLGYDPLEISKPIYKGDIIG